MFRTATLLAVVTAGLAIAGSAHAATLTYVGFQANVESDADTATTGWRNAGPVKPLDIDGDNILGTDGYITPGRSQGAADLKDLPDYIGSATGSFAKNTFGLIDDPTDPTGGDVAGWLWWNRTPLVDFTIAGTGLDGVTLRVGLLIGTRTAGGSTYAYTVNQTVGGIATASASGLTVAGNVSGMAFFDLQDVSAGDKFEVIGTGGDIAGNVAGLTFDTLVPEPASLALLGLGGLLIARRRK